MSVTVTRASQWQWCTRCGRLWDDHYTCPHPEEDMAPFPKELCPSVDAAYMLGQGPAVWVIEQQLFQTRKR